MTQAGVGSGRLPEEVTSKPKPEQYIRIGQIGSLCIWGVGGGGVRNNARGNKCKCPEVTDSMETSKIVAVLWCGW